MCSLDGSGVEGEVTLLPVGDVSSGHQELIQVREEKVLEVPGAGQQAVVHGQLPAIVPDLILLHRQLPGVHCHQTSLQCHHKH